MCLNPPAATPKQSLVWPLWLRGYTRAKPSQLDADTNTVPTVLTIQEACAALRISKWTLYQLIRSRQLATIKIRGRRVVSSAAIQALLERLQEEETA